MASSPPLNQIRPAAHRSGARSVYEKLAELEKKFVVGMRAAAAGILVSLTALGCSSGDDLPPPLGGGVPGSNNYQRGPCTEGAEFRCSATVEQSSGVLSCWEGTQRCVDGAWGPCVGELSHKVDPQHSSQSGFFRQLALSTPEPCVGNPCDPSCQVFNEDPPDITPGGGGGDIPDWSAPPGTAPCGHQLCTEGAALDRTCHPCAAAVCDIDASCCSSAWTATCVDLVYSECGSGPPVGPSVCDYTLFSATTLTGGGNQGIMVGGPVGAADAGGVGNNAVRLGRVTVDEVVSGGGVFLDATDVIGTVSANGYIDCQNNPVIGDPSIGQCFMTDTSNVQFPEIPIRNFTCITPSGSVDVNSGSPVFNPGETRRININNNTAQVILSGPGNYAHIHFNASGTLVFAQPGVYTFNTLYLGGSNPRVLVPPTGTVNIDTCAELHFDNGAETYAYNYDGSVYTQGPRPNPLSVQWYTNKACTGSQDVKLGPGALASGVLIAPYCKVHIYSGNNVGTVEGLVYANALQIEPGVHIDATSLVGEACRNAGIGGGGPSTCPVTLDLPEVPPPFREPCRSGLDCQVNSRCTNVATEAACAHSKCLEGEPLGPGCDPCVARICAQDPTCCTSAWTPSCVERVKTVCDAWCGELSGCSHDVCETGGPLANDCSECATIVCSTPGREYCCTTTWNSACVATAQEQCEGDGLPPTYQTCNFAVLGSAIVDGRDPRVMGDMGGGNVTLAREWGWSPAGISGDLYAETNPTTMNIDLNTFVTGDVIVGPVPATPATKTLTCPTGGANQSYSSNATLAPGTYGAVSQNGWGATLTLQAGTYNVQSFTIANGARLALPATGEVIINSCGPVRFGDQSRVTGVTTAADALRLSVYSASTSFSSTGCTGNAICIGPSTSTLIYGTFTAPNGGAFISQDATLYGYLHAQRVYLRHRTTVDASGVTGAPCHIAAGTCSIETPPPSVNEAGSCVDNALGFTDASCATPDLAVNLACDSQITVCNHGAAGAPSGAELTFYPRSAQQFATATPDASWAAGVCTVTSAIPAGQCVTQTCDAALLDQDMTIMVNASSSLNECSRLDNWSFYVSAGCEGGGAEVVTEVYEAICPEATSPRWGLLAWETTTPGNSAIRWIARTADSEAGLASQSFVPVGASRSTPTDTQSCPLTSTAAGCPVDLTGALLGSNRRHQPSYLELQVHLDVSGPDAPTLRDWKITYSCIYDE